MMTSLHNSTFNLNEAIQQYRENREQLVNLQAQTLNAFHQIANIIQTTSSDIFKCINIDSLSDVLHDLGGSEKEQTNNGNINLDYNQVDISSEYQPEFHNIEIGNPPIAIVGQVKAGKSTLVNSLLKKNVVYQSYQRCTSRLTRLTYSEINFVELVDIDGTVSQRKLLKKDKIPMKYMQLNENDRNNLLEIRKEVRAGIDSQFLKNGIDIIDTPGLSEISILSNLSKEMVKHLLPVIIYVIDGRTSVKQSDIADILELKKAVPNLKIIYFITKLDADDPTDLQSTSFLDLAESKMQIAFKKLQYNNLIPPIYKNWSECKYFHGSSLYSYMDYHKKQITAETLYHLKRFENFQSSLSYFLQLNFENKISESCDTMINFHVNVLTKIIIRSKSLSNYSDKYEKQIKKIRSIEEELFFKIKSAIFESKKDLIKRLVKRLKNESQFILNPIRDMEYPSSIRIPESGLVNQKYIVQQCQEYIMCMMCFGLENIVQEFVEEELFSKYRKEIENHISDRMKNELGLLGEKLMEKSPYTLCLRRILIDNYKLNISNSFSNDLSSNSILKIINIILISIKVFMWKIFSKNSSIGCIDVKSSEWKRKQALNCLNKCDYILLAEEVCKSLILDFENKHNDFETALKYEEDFMKNNISISESIREQITKTAPYFTNLLMYTLDVKSRYMLQNVEEKELIGRGAQYCIYRCICEGKEIAKKTCSLQTDRLNGIAEEVYYSYLFEHPRLLPLIAISIKSTNSFKFKEISIYIPLMKTDVLNYLQNNKICLEDRLKIGLQTAEALQYLHNQEIMHRDLKLANILLDEENNVYLADYGFCKSTALSNNSLVGTPIHMAPEIIKNSNYNSKVDIYAFGILLWYLVEGNGNHPIHANVNHYQVLWKTAEHHIRPERLDNISDELWDLMTECWNKDPNVRPEIDVVISKMNEIINYPKN